MSFTDRNGTQWRNLTEQVLKNKEDITNLLTGAATLAEFGLKVINVSETGAGPINPPELIAGDDSPYGYSWLVRQNFGTVPAIYFLWIWTRLDFATEAAWLNLGEFPKLGPQGLPGATGATGLPGATGATGTRGTKTNFVSTLPSTDMLIGDAAVLTNDPLLPYYRWSGSQWSFLGNLKGETGSQGPQGSNGLTPRISAGYWWIGETNTGVLAEGRNGTSFTVHAGVYTPSSIPNFSATEVGDAFIVDDGIEPSGQDLWFHGYGGLDWTKIVNWGGVPGPQGPQPSLGSLLNPSTTQAPTTKEVADALEDKIPKLKIARSAAYTVNSVTGYNLVDYTFNATGGTLMQRHSAGNAFVTTPVFDDDIANKAYVDTAVIPKPIYPRQANETRIIFNATEGDNFLHLHEGTGVHHTYAAAGYYEIRIKGDYPNAQLDWGDGSPKGALSLIQGIQVNNTSGKEKYIEVHFGTNALYDNALPANALYGCSNLVSASIPEGTVGIGANAFKDCDALAFMSIPLSVITIGVDAFYNCPNLVNRQYINSVTGTKILAEVIGTTLNLVI